MRALLQLFRFLLDVQGAVLVGVRIARGEDGVELVVRRRSHAVARCPTCGREMGGEKRPVWVRWRHLNLMGKRSYLVCEVREGRCPKHGRRIESVPWASGRARHTRIFDRQVASLVQVADKSACSRMFKVCWRTVGRIVKRVVAELLPEDRLEGLVAIGVDETSYKRGHRYLTVVTDLVTGRVIWVKEGKTAETLGAFFEELGAERRRRLGVVSMDMSEAYLKAVKAWVPHAEVIYDRFHVVKLLLEALDEIRREECRKTEGEARKALKKTRFALLRNPKHQQPNDLEAIERVRASNRRLTRAYELRVDFEDLWGFEDEEKARVFLMRWTRAALWSRLEPLRKFARTVRAHIKGILGFVRHAGATNAASEGINNKIKLIIHKAYGFRSLESLMAMVYLCCSGITVA